ncbi:hypothetical protein Sste5344_000966 [Sporothrix stenoceras]
MATASTAAILDQVATFLKDASTSNTDAQQLLRYVLARPETAAVQYVLPADEMDERLAFADAVQHALQADSANASLSKFSMAVIFSLPLQQIRVMTRALHSPETQVFGDFSSFSNTAENLVRIFLIQSNRPTTTSGNVRRDKQQSEVATGKAAAGQWKQQVPGNGYRQWVQDWDQRPRYGGGSDPADKEGIVAAAYATTSRLVQSGHVINIAMPSMEDGVRMKAMLDIQWACIRIASMSAAAGDPEFLKDPFDDDWGSDVGEYAEEASQLSQGEEEAGLPDDTTATAHTQSVSLVAVPRSSRRTAEYVSKADEGEVPTVTQLSPSKKQPSQPPQAGSPPLPEVPKTISRRQAPPTHKTPQVLQEVVLVPSPDQKMTVEATATVAKTPRAGTRTKIRTISKRVGQKLQRALKAGSQAGLEQADAGAAPAAS